MIDVLERLSPRFPFLSRMKGTVVRNTRPEEHSYFFVHAVVALQFRVVFRFRDAEQPGDLLTSETARRVCLLR